MEDYGFEYSDEEPEEQDVDIENQYYNSKGSFLFSFFKCLKFHINFPFGYCFLYLKSIFLSNKIDGCMLGFDCFLNVILFSERYSIGRCF